MYLEADYSAAAGCYERAYTAYRRERQHMAAGRAARTVSWITGNLFSDWAVGNGWLGRARTILTEAGEDSPERGWVRIIEAFAEPDVAKLSSSSPRGSSAGACRSSAPKIQPVNGVSPRYFPASASTSWSSSPNHRRAGAGDDREPL